MGEVAPVPEAVFEGALRQGRRRSERGSEFRVFSVKNDKLTRKALTEPPQRTTNEVVGEA